MYDLPTIRKQLLHRTQSASFSQWQRHLLWDKKKSACVDSVRARFVCVCVCGCVSVCLFVPFVDVRVIFHV